MKSLVITGPDAAAASRLGTTPGAADEVVVTFEGGRR